MHLRAMLLFYASRGASGLAFGITSPVIVLALQARGFSLASVGLGYGIVGISTFLLEIPTGVVSDLTSRKLSLALAGASMTAGTLLLVMSSGLTFFYIAFALLGTGYAFSSGTVSAWMHDTLEDRNAVAHFETATGIGVAIRTGSMVAGSAIAGVLAAFWGLQIAMLSAAIGYGLSAVLSLLLREPSAIQKLRAESESFGQRIQAFAVHTKESITIVIKSGAFLSLTFLHLVVFRITSTPKSLFGQPYFTSFGWTPAMIAPLYVVFGLIQAFFAAFSGPIKRLTGGNERRTLGMLAIGIFASLALIAISRSVAVIIAGYVIVSITGGLYLPFAMKAANDRAETGKRASILSTLGMGFQITSLIVSPAFGRLSDMISIRASVQWFAIIFGALAVVAFLWCGKALRPSES